MNTSPVLGVCKFMCPESEGNRRRREGKLNIFEFDSQGRCDPVKEYVRSGLGHEVPDPLTLRPPAVLVKTLEHLIRNITDRTDQPWFCVYDFVNNRIQSLRQDIVYQQLDGQEALCVQETAVRFYLYSHYRLSGLPWEKFDPKLNLDQLQQCLLSVLRLNDANTTNSSSSSKCDHRLLHDATRTHRVCSGTGASERKAEFWGYYLLVNLGSTEAAREVLSHYKAKRHLCGGQLRLVYDINKCFMEGNVVRLFRLTHLLPPLSRCAVFLHINKIRRIALQIMNKAYGNRESHFPLQVLTKWLGCVDLTAITEFCQACGLGVSEGSVKFNTRHALKPLNSQAPEHGQPLPLHCAIPEFHKTDSKPSQILMKL